jgi:TatD DNase family protein
MRTLPALDLHAHVDATIAAQDLVALNAAVFAVTRSLEEAGTALRRNDSMTVWGLGCHPGLIEAQKAFTASTFSELLDSTPLVGEVGLDGRSRVPIATQVTTFRSILQTLQTKPRITSIHSFAACEEVLELLAEVPTVSAVLHWWLGTPAQTARAIELGCYFSVNASMLRRSRLLEAVPLDRILTETDHPFGDRGSRSVRRPGAVSNIEDAIAAANGLRTEAVRVHVWRNLRELAFQADVVAMLPKELRRHLAAV